MRPCIILTKSNAWVFDLGDPVIVQRAGDVIPKVVRVIEAERTGKEKAFTVPTECPVCKAPIAKEKEIEVAYRCTNSGCPAQLIASVLHFASRDAMDIDGLGESVLFNWSKKNLLRILRIFISWNGELF